MQRCEMSVSPLSPFLSSTEQKALSCVFRSIMLPTWFSVLMVETVICSH